MINITYYVLVTVVITILFTLGLVLSYIKTPDKEKNRAFECGFDPLGQSRVQFCMKFFLIGVIFLIFDVEVLLIIPLPFSSTFLILFLTILMIGLVYE